MNNSIKGEKHICSNCGAKFFDLNKSPIICPKCNTEVVEKSSNVKLRLLYLNLRKMIIILTMRN